MFPGAAGLAQRVLYTHTGVRPLPHQPRGAEGAITRRHIMRRHRAARGLYSIVGGKLTTHRALAEDVLRKVRDELPRPVDRTLDARPAAAGCAAYGRARRVARRAARPVRRASSAAALARLRQIRGGHRGARGSSRAGRTARRRRPVDGRARATRSRRSGPSRSKTCCSAGAWRGSARTSVSARHRRPPARSSASVSGMPRAPRTSSPAIASSPRATGAGR